MTRPTNLYLSGIPQNQIGGPEKTSESFAVLGDPRTHGDSTDANSGKKVHGASRHTPKLYGKVPGVFGQHVCGEKCFLAGWQVDFKIELKGSVLRFEA